MSVIHDLLRDVPLPRMAHVRQIFPADAVADVEAALRTQLRLPHVAQTIRRRARIAVGVGSRGLAELPLLARVVVDELKHAGASPFIVPAMGSHGGATDEGQKALLAALGVTEASAGCPIVSSMETVQLGTLDGGMPILIDRNAMEADGIVVINRVKPHTSFSGAVESGLAKMIAIGLGKQKGADAVHAPGFGEMAKNVIEIAKAKLAKAPILFGVATVENAYEKIAKVEAIPVSQILAREEQLLIEAKRNMPRILFNPLDVLIVDKMGKEFSGTGTDPNITGRASTPFVAPAQKVARMVILDLSDRSKGNATGVGLADVCTKRLFEKIDREATYANHITATVLAHAKIPMIMDSDRLAIQAAIKTCNLRDLAHVRVVRIPNTLHLEHIEISEALLDDAARDSAIEMSGAPSAWTFDAAGNLLG